MEWGFGKQLENGDTLLQKKCFLLVGNGQRVKFWFDKWYSDTPLSFTFPSLFAVSSSKEAWVWDV